MVVMVSVLMFVLVLAGAGCTKSDTPEDRVVNPTEEGVAVESDQEVDLNDVGYTLGIDKEVSGSEGHDVLEVSKRVILALGQDLESIAPYVHPEKGVRFTPYSYVTEKDVVLTREEVENAGNDTEIRLWGHMDGIGTPIELTSEGYYERFVYGQDFINAEKKSQNDPIGGGNSINNASEYYPDAEIFEYHFPGFDEQFDGMDWESLRIVLEKHEGEWYVVGIIHAQWTI